MTRLFDHPYADFLHRVSKPTRYTGAEYGVVRKDWTTVESRICLAFPDVYDIGMSHLGFRILYDLLNKDSRTLAERCYAPWVDMHQELANRGLPLVSLESAKPLSVFDVVGFSLQFELTYTNILSMLDLGGIERRSANRQDDAPLVIAGGPVATHAEPIAPFIDAFLIGDGEEATTEIALTWAAAKREGLPRAARLQRLSQIQGVYVPSSYETAIDIDSGFEVVVGTKDDTVPLPIRRRLVADLNQFPFPERSPVGGPEAIFDRMSIEVARGCTEGCRFCQAGMIYRPVRERDPEQIVKTVINALEASGQDEVSLTALSTADISCISPLIKRLAEVTAPERVSLSVASLRAYGLPENLLDAMRQVRASGLTFAPEAGTQRLRDVINKNVTEEQLLETASRVFSRGYDRMKLYFILGLPTETDEDVLGIAEVARHTLRVGKSLGRRPQVTVSASTHVPKPHTPFQWCAMDELDEIERKQRLLRDSLRAVRGITLRTHDSRTSWLEGILTRGDRLLADVIERAYVNGARFDSWDEHFRLDIWQEALDYHGIDVARRLGTLPITARLPWDHLDLGLEDGFLAKEYRNAVRGRLSPPCGKAKGMFVHHTNVADATADARRLVCYDCGVACDLTTMRSRRIQYLDRMGATVSTESEGDALTVESASNEANDDAPRTQKRWKHPESFRPSRTGGEPERWRLAYSKLGPAALLGHLDLARELPRIVRRAGVRTAYTKGFNPKAAMSFSPALPLGTPGLEEFLDLRLIEAPEPTELLEMLSLATPDGIAFSAAVKLGPNDPGLSRIIDEARYAIGIADVVLRQELAEPLEESVARFLAKGEVFVNREFKGRRKSLDIRALCNSIIANSPRAHANLASAGLVGKLSALEITLPLDPSGAARPGEVVEALFGRPIAHQAVRIGLRAKKHSPLDLEHFRKIPTGVDQEHLGAASQP